MSEPTERPNRLERAFLVGVHGLQRSEDEAANLLDELAELVRTLGISVAASAMVRMREPQPRFYIGAGKAAEIIAAAKAANCEAIIFDDELTPAQQRNWEAESKLAVIDRQEVILDIFGDRARTREAVLQVELARLEYSLPRLKRAWTHLSRQRGGGGSGAGGGGGAQRGEGETQLELDSRMVRTRIARLKQELEAVVRHREVQRRLRLRKPVPTAALVGYTNAGKSSLLNRLTGSQVLAVNQLFATLDPTTRRLALPSGRHLLATDTVGFVRRLPHRLVEAFKATLEEALVADVLVHVLDAAHPDVEAHRATTLAVLAELGAEGKPMLTVWNKADLLPPHRLAALQARPSPHEVTVSCQSGLGFDDLLAKLDTAVGEDTPPVRLLIPHHRWDLVHKLHLAGAITRQEPVDDGVLIVGRIPARLLETVRPYQSTEPLPAGDQQPYQAAGRGN